MSAQARAEGRQAIADWAQGSLAAGRTAARVAERYRRMVEAYEGGQRS